MIPLDHLVYAVPELKSGVSYLEELLGIDILPGGRHLQFGTHNALFRIGENSYFEIIAPDPENPRDHPLWMGLSEIRPPGMLTRWALQHSLSDILIRGLKAYDPQLASISEGQREKTDGKILKWLLTPPAATPLVESCPFFIDWSGSNHPSHDMPQVCEIKFIEVTSPRSDDINELFKKLNIDFKVKKSKNHLILVDLECPKGIITIS